jgi:hypothetical protein
MTKLWRLTGIAVFVVASVSPALAAPRATPAPTAALESQAAAGNPRALQELRSFARAENAVAQYNLGFMYDSGQGVPQSYPKAVYWYRKAAVQGDAPAQYNLGLMYDNGRGVPQDDARALKWFIVAKAGGSKTAAHEMRVVERTATPAKVTQAQALATQWWAAHHRVR